MLLKKVQIYVALDLDFENKPAEHFITADIYTSKADYLSLYNHLTGKKENSISVQLAMQVKNEFLQSVSHFATVYEWIYNPPMLGKISAWTAGKAARQDFAQDYGAWSELVYLIMHGERLTRKKVEKMVLSDFLARGEYHLRKRAVESIE